MRATVFLDRDGVINHRIMGGYVNHRDAFNLLPGVIQSMVWLSQRFRVAIVTNQQGIARGLTDPQFVRDLHADLERQVVEAGGQALEYFVCPHHRDAGCACRKPRAGLLNQAHEVEAVDWEKSFLVGDSDSDIAAGASKSVTTIKIGEQGEPAADYTAASLRDAIGIVERVSSR